MMTELLDPEPCMYLSGKTATLEHSFEPFISPADYERLMNEGWRKFGSFLFRPRCRSCQECQPIRVPVATFKPNRSQRRCAAKNRDLSVLVGRPAADEARLALFRRYHAHQTERKGWPTASLDREDYFHQFLLSSVPMLEVTIRDGDALRAIVLLDATPRALSAVYHFHDPFMRERGLGTLVLLQALKVAEDMGKEFLYLGYYVQGSGSMQYKGSFRPSEILSPEGRWAPYQPNQALLPDVASPLVHPAWKRKSG